jgi:hypothetical protein
MPPPGGPGPGDGGTSSGAAPRLNLATEEDPEKIRAVGGGAEEPLMSSKKTALGQLEALEAKALAVDAGTSSLAQAEQEHLAEVAEARHRVELKTKRSRRTVAISPELANRLAEHRLAMGRPEGEALVFTRPDGRQWRHQATDRALARSLREAGVPRVSWHDLRHAHVSRLFAAGRDPVSIAARVGDSIDTVLRTYAHEYDAARRRKDESDQLAALYDHGSHGSFMEAPNASIAQQSGIEPPTDLALQREIRDKTA